MKKIKLKHKEPTAALRARGNFPVQLTVGMTVLFCTDSSKLPSGRYLALLTAVGRTCTLHRSVLLRAKLDEGAAMCLLKRWADILKFEYIE